MADVQKGCGACLLLQWPCGAGVPLVKVFRTKVPREGCFHLGFEGFPVSLENVGESSFGSLFEDCGCLKLDQDRQVVGVQRSLGPPACRSEALIGGHRYV